MSAAIRDAAPPIALVTGAGQAAGRAVALALARAGFDVAFVYQRQRELAAELAAAIEAAGRRALALHADPSDPSTPRRLAAATRAALGPVDLLVNAATSERDGGGLPDLTVDAVDRCFVSTVRVPLFLAQAVHDDLAQSPVGRIISLAREPHKKPFENQVVGNVIDAAATELSRAIGCALAATVQSWTVLVRHGPLELPDAEKLAAVVADLATTASDTPAPP